MPDFNHERLEAYRYALVIARWIRTVDWPRGDAPLKDQAWRASASVVLNIAEGASLTGGRRRNHLRIALGSAAELAAVLDIVMPPGAEQHAVNLRRVGAILATMSR